jgi:hypothetical protein
MPTAWTLTAQEVITDALTEIGVLGAGQTASASDYDVCLRGLQNIMKEMPLHGLSWPKITAAPVALTWSSLTPAQVSMPADYFGVPAISFTQSGANVDLEVIAKAVYDAILQPATTAAYPQMIYIAPNNIGYLYPVPTVDPALSMTYQAITLDAEMLTTPDVVQSWVGGLVLWLAYEVAPKFGVPMGERQDIERRFLMRRALMLAYAAETAPICFQVRD